MSKSLKIAGIFFLIMLFVFCFYYYINLNVNTNQELSALALNDSIVGCYASASEQNIYTMKVATMDGNAVTGELAYNNFGQGMQNGIFSGVFQNDMMIVSYAYASSGVSGNKQIVFKKIGSSFVQGYSTTEEEMNEQSTDNPDNINLNLGYNPNPTFIKLGSCK